MSTKLNTIMEAASQSLAEMDYVACERGCLEALAAAREARDWAYYARILLPLQEARRQRRMTAADGRVLLGTAGLESDLPAALADLQAGCVVATRPHTADDVRRAADSLAGQPRHIELLFVDSDASADTWTVRSAAGPELAVDLPAPPKDWRGQWWSPQPPESDAVRWRANLKRTPADWFIDATEALGDRAIASVDTGLPAVEQLEALEHCLEAITDHEKLHQRLAGVARTLSRG